jgi:uncharacterized protein YndB with AHSA1/START domain
MTAATFEFDPKLDLVLRRTVDVSPALVWKAWTTPEHLMPWFCPTPWRATDCRIDLRPGGEFFTVMEGPAGERFENAGCYLEIIPEKRLTWTNALLPGFRPSGIGADSPVDFPFTAFIDLAPAGEGGCRYTATALHTTDAHRQRHADMGFEQGWGTVLEQLVAYVKGL